MKAEVFAAQFRLHALQEARRSCCKLLALLDLQMSRIADPLMLHQVD